MALSLLTIMVHWSLCKEHFLLLCSHLQGHLVDIVNCTLATNTMCRWTSHNISSVFIQELIVTWRVCALQQSLTMFILRARLQFNKSYFLWSYFHPERFLGQPILDESFSALLHSVLKLISQMRLILFTSLQRWTSLTMLYDSDSSYDDRPATKQV